MLLMVKKAELNTQRKRNIMAQGDTIQRKGHSVMMTCRLS